MTIVMVHIVHDTTVSYSHGLAALAGALTSTDVALVTVRGDDAEGAAGEIAKSAPSVVLFTAMSNQWETAKRIAYWLREAIPRVPLVVGGSHVIAAPQTVHESPFDLGVTGEAEALVDDFVSASQISGLASSGHRLLAGAPASDLDKLPRPRLDIFEKRDVLAYPSVMFSRGCPYRCSYCMSRRGGQTGTIRWKSPRRAIAEVRDLIEYADPPEIYIDDDTFLKRPKWVMEFCELYRREIARPFFCNARPETVKPAVVEVLAAAGCAAVGIGIESGSARIRSEVLDRRMSDDMIVQAFDLLHQAGLKTWSFNMVGIPGETPDDLLATVKLNERVQTDYVRISIFTPYPGTPFFDDSEHTYVRGYFRAADSLDDDMRKIYEAWLRNLADGGRLWFTEAEELLVG